MWPDRRILDLFGIDLPILQAPMAGSSGSALAIAVAEAGGLGSLPCAMLSPEQARAEIGIFRQRVTAPLNLNFFCHQPPAPDAAREQAWKKRLEPFYAEFGLPLDKSVPATSRAPFDETLCVLVEETRPEIVSFHFGLPDGAALDRVKATGAKVISSATTAEEACWLESRGCDAIIAQGYEAGGHRGIFLSDDVSSQPGTFALVPQVVDAVKVPVIAAGGIADARGIVAAFALGAAAVQIGTAYLLTPESVASPTHRAALQSASNHQTALTNLFTGRPARGIVNRLMREVGPMSGLAPQFPLAIGAVAPLRSKAEAQGSGDFSPLWSGQAAALAKPTPARDYTMQLAKEAGDMLQNRLRRT